MDDETLAALAISETGFIFNPRTGCSYLTGPVGAVILDSLKKGQSLEDICRIITERFEVPDGTSLDEDIGQFVYQLQCEGLITARSEAETRALKSMDFNRVELETPIEQMTVSSINSVQRPHISLDAKHAETE